MGKKPAKRVAENAGVGASSKKPKPAEPVNPVVSQGVKASGICELCRARGTGSNAVEWASRSNGKPCGSQCMECFNLWQTGFMYLSWDDVVKLNSTEDPGACKL